MSESSTAVGNRNGEPSSVTGLTSSLETVSVPVRGPREALIKVDAVGICAATSSAITERPSSGAMSPGQAWAGTEVDPGYECAGTVVRLDDGPAAWSRSRYPSSRNW